MVQRGLGKSEQQILLAPNPMQIGNQFSLRALLCPRVDLVHQCDEQVHQAVDDLALPSPGQRREQGQPHCLIVRTQVRRVLRGRPGPQHPTYTALVEWGRAVKSVFVARYLRSEALRREINDGLQVVENWNSANGALFYAEVTGGLRAGCRVDLRCCLVGA